MVGQRNHQGITLTMAPGLGRLDQRPPAMRAQIDAAAAEAGVPVAAVRVNPQGEIVIVIGKLADPQSAANEWDEVLDAQDAQVR
jgi:hypothetical protein